MPKKLHFVDVFFQIPLRGMELIVLLIAAAETVHYQLVFPTAAIYYSILLQSPRGNPLQFNALQSDAQKFHLLDHFRQFLFEKFLAHLLEYDVLGFGCDEIADATLVVDDARRRHSLVGAHDGVGVHPELDAVVAHRQDTIVGLQFAAQDLLIQLRANLQVYGFVCVEFHGLVFLCLDFTIGEVEQHTRDDDAKNHAPNHSIMGNTNYLTLRIAL